MSEIVPEFEANEQFFPKIEKEMMAEWDKIEILNKIQEKSKDKKRYVYFEGPPFATGLPHYGNICAGIVKDVVIRWAYQTDHHIERKFGWDCHGLPVEYQLDKELGITGPDDVKKMGIAVYNDKCRSIVTKCSQDWQVFIKRIGRWIDLNNDYKTMHFTFMESVWWVFKQLYIKGLVYNGYKVMPFSTACCTPLSNFEASQNFKIVQDPSICIEFVTLQDKNVSFIAWTTTPWTLPSNLALCVNPEFTYVKLEDVKTKKIYIVCESRIDQVFKNVDDYKIVCSLKGKELENVEYESLFDYFKYKKSDGAFRVLCDTYVSDESGTGVVHQAPYFGEDDNRIGLKYGIIKKGEKPVCPVDFSGKFTDPVSDYKGMYIKDADKLIIKDLKKRKCLYSHTTASHSYPYCWRSNTPLIYRAVPSWFIAVESFKDKLLDSLKDVHWVPNHVKEKRFGNWLRDARDWAVSRNRYWGNPIPLWVSDDGEEIVCIESVQELEALSGVTGITDLHRQYVDDITIPSKREGKPPLKRIPEIFDCWFESASMFLAQHHYPFENKDKLSTFYRADFISEGLDQTRGWFYTQIVISTALFGECCYKNVIGHGLVLAEDGQKMSKSKKNYPDPILMFDKYGADALRMYLINSPLVTAQNLKFSESGLRGIIRDVSIPLYNSFRYLTQNINRYEDETGKVYTYDEEKNVRNSYMDNWIVSLFFSLVKDARASMKRYTLSHVLPSLLSFIDNFSKVYINLNKNRMIGRLGVEDQLEAINTHFMIQLNLCTLLASFMPFIADYIYMNLKDMIKTDNVGIEPSVHLIMIPETRMDLIDEEIERKVALMNNCIYIGLRIRTQESPKRRLKLPTMIVIVNSKQQCEDLETLSHYIKKIINVQKLIISDDRKKFNVDINVKPNFNQLSARYKSSMKQVTTIIRNMSFENVSRFMDGVDEINIDGFDIKKQDLLINLQHDSKKDKKTSSNENMISSCHNNMIVLLDVNADQESIKMSLASEICHRIQKLRKSAKILPVDDIVIYLKADGEIMEIFYKYFEFINDTIGKPVKLFKENSSIAPECIISDSFLINDSNFDLYIHKNNKAF